MSRDTLRRAAAGNLRLQKSDFLLAVADLVVPSNYEGNVDISVHELREILLTGKNCLTVAETEDVLATQPNQNHFSLEQFWEEYEEVLQKYAAAQKITTQLKDHSPNTKTSRFGLLEAQNAFKTASKKDKFHQISRGYLTYENAGQIHGHQFELDVSADTDLTVMIQPVSLPVMTGDIDPAYNDLDVDVFLLREIDSNIQHRRLTAFTNTVDRHRRFGFQQKLLKGHYILVPFTSGAWFRDRRVDDIMPEKDHQKLFTRTGGDAKLTAEYLSALEAIFEMADLDGNGRLDRHEFEIFANRTTGDVVQDEDWKVVTGSFPTEDGQLNKDGFLQLHKMEAADSSDANVRDLWITLEAMGFSSELNLNKTLVYQLYIGSSACQPTLTATEIRPATALAEKCIIRAAIERGSSETLEADIVLHKISNGSRFSLVLENTGHQEQIIECELKEAENCISSKEFPEMVRIQAKKAAVMAHFVPRDSKLPWKINTTELVK